MIGGITILPCLALLFLLIIFVNISDLITAVITIYYTSSARDVIRSCINASRYLKHPGLSWQTVCNVIVVTAKVFVRD